MSQVKGTISVDVAFTDSTTVSGANSLKTLTLRQAQEYTATSDKVVILSGTAGTAQLSLGLLGTTPYRNAAGNVVTLNAINRIVFSWSPGVGALTPADGLTASRRLLFYGGGESTTENALVALTSYGNIPAMSAVNNFVGTLVLTQAAVTGNYTIIIYSAA